MSHLVLQLSLLHFAVGAPSFELFGAFFPAWMLCGAIGIAGAIVARVLFVKTGLAEIFPYQLFVCAAIGSTLAMLVWLRSFA
ncbi:MAG: YtcA family lipoprotein [Pseudomonadota bacterium]